MNNLQGRQSIVNDTACSPKDYISFGTTLIMAVTCGMAVANIYYNQPLLGIMQDAFTGQEMLTGLVPTATQLGYALGLILLVPLGDRIERRRLILMQTAALSVALASVAMAPNATVLLVASICVGMTASVAQQILPFAAEMASPERRGSTIGIVISGLLCGILLSRVLSGVIGEYFGWRAMFWLGLVLAVLMGLVLARALPLSSPKTNGSYSKLLQSLFVLWHQEPVLRRATIIQACVFGSFSALWTILALRLDTHYHLGANVAGLFGMVGTAGVLFAPAAGRIADRRGPRFVIGLSTLAMLAGWVLLGIWNTVTGMITGVVLLDFGAQGAQISNQHVIHGLRPEARNRLVAILMGGMFTGGALGSAGSSLAWNFGGWPAVCCIAAVLAILACLIHLFARRT